MKTLIFGAGPLGSLYAHRLHQAGKDVTILARNGRYHFIKENGLILINEHTGEEENSPVKVVHKLTEDDDYDLVIVVIRKNKLEPVFDILKRNKQVKNILFMGNNSLGFEEYLKHLPAEKILFGFPGGGGSQREQITGYIDSEQPGGKRIPIRVGEMEGVKKVRTRQIISLFESSQVPVEYVKSVDGWLKYHAAFILPIASILYYHDCDNFHLAGDNERIRLFVRACREGGRVLRKLGYLKRQPFVFNLFYWLPEFVTAKVFAGTFKSKYAEIGFARHAKAALDEMKELSQEFMSLIDKTSLKTPNIDLLRTYFQR
ncbi:MAG: ketopantoate reductase family protein [Deltaproteobacteria bacterium]|nr:ketopantoate reductase family protein [Deltaproteobacteria bacterium]MBT4266539.1 ketopantoate reductase family protein [Deltaproteobacteria bacterium]MBT4643544.1 ketopantoate reductase family protein [Deltaproteobacteria bacterium]MBT6500916.1 ketopantoate reductase family protein [Deltaproteobacteria bacterium]MBT6613578.1 ketopantoate reductase family protein [Deltaproteobacteria bacterium]